MRNSITQAATCLTVSILLLAETSYATGRGSENLILDDVPVESVQLIGVIPAEYGLDIRAIYRWSETGSACRANANQNKAVYWSDYSINIESHVQRMNFKIPLNHVKHKCSFELRNLEASIKARHGSEQTPEVFEQMGADVYDMPNEDPSQINSSGELQLLRRCSWRFVPHESNDNSIKRIFYCSGKFGSLNKRRLANNTINFALKDLGEEPGHSGAWTKFPSGWKPCALNRLEGGCSQPRIFLPFKIDGKKCTVYPNCTEQ